MTEQAPRAAGAPAPADIERVEDVSLEALHARVQEFADRSARFITATCLDRGDAFEVLYHFDEGLQMRHLRLLVARDAVVPSISGIYLAAFLVENEIKELFGLEVSDVAIDYHGRLYLTDDSDPAPMARPPANGASEP